MKQNVNVLEMNARTHEITSENIILLPITQEDYVFVLLPYVTIRKKLVLAIYKEKLISKKLMCFK